MKNSPAAIQIIPRITSVLPIPICFLPENLFRFLIPDGSDMVVSRFHGNPAAGRTGDETDLHKVWFAHIFNRIAFLADCG